MLHVTNGCAKLCMPVHYKPVQACNDLLKKMTEILDSLVCPPPSPKRGPDSLCPPPSPERGLILDFRGQSI